MSSFEWKTKLLKAISGAYVGGDLISERIWTIAKVETPHQLHQSMLYYWAVFCHCFVIGLCKGGFISEYLFILIPSPWEYAKSLSLNFSRLVSSEGTVISPILTRMGSNWKIPSEIQPPLRAGTIRHYRRRDVRSMYLIMKNNGVFLDLQNSNDFYWIFHSPSAKQNYVFWLHTFF